MKHFDKLVKDLKEGKGVSFQIDLTVDSDTGTAVFDGLTDTTVGFATDEESDESDSGNIEIEQSFFVPERVMDWWEGHWANLNEAPTFSRWPSLFF